MFLPMHSRSGLISSNSGLDLAPTINVNVPISAPFTPPDTGASLNVTDFSSHKVAILREATMSIVLQSMHFVVF